MRLSVRNASTTVAFADHQKSTRVRWHILWISDDPKIASALHDSKASRRRIIENYNQYVEIKRRRYFVVNTKVTHINRALASAICNMTEQQQQL